MEKVSYQDYQWEDLVEIIKHVIILVENIDIKLVGIDLPKQYPAMNIKVENRVTVLSDTLKEFFGEKINLVRKVLWLIYQCIMQGSLCSASFLQPGL